MADVCGKHNVKLLTYGTLVRCLYSQQDRQRYIDHVTSVEASLQINGSGNASPASMMRPQLQVSEK